MLNSTLSCHVLFIIDLELVNIGKIISFWEESLIMFFFFFCQIIYRLYFQKLLIKSFKIWPPLETKYFHKIEIHSFSWFYTFIFHPVFKAIGFIFIYTLYKFHYLVFIKFKFSNLRPKIIVLVEIFIYLFI